MEQLPQPCRALAILLGALHWKANRLAAALKVDPDKVYDYLRGKSVPPRDFLEQAAVAMGLPARHVDRTAVDRGDYRAQLLINRATTLKAMGDHEGAIATLHEAGRHIDAAREPRLAWFQVSNLAVNLLYLGRHEAAEELLPEIRRLSPPGVSRTRLMWLEGAVAAGLGRVEEAETLLLEVKEEFLELRNAFDAALVSLDLAALYLRQNRTAEVKKLATGMVKTFLDLKVHKEALPAARLFQEAAVREQATVELVGRLAAYLRRAQHEAALRFGG